MSLAIAGTSGRAFASRIACLTGAVALTLVPVHVFAGLPPTGARVAQVARGADTTAAPPGPFFYRGLPYGSESLVHPLRLIVNGGFGILQFDNRDNRLSEVDFSGGWHRVTSDVLHPVRAIEVGGWGDFLEREVLPFSVSRKSAQYWPNYTLHLIGGGMTWRTMREWYAFRGTARPAWWATGTMAVYHVLNEVVENEDRPGPTTDPVADLYLFDPAAIWLFAHPGVSGFFANRLSMRDWSNQPAIDFAKGTIENQGQNFSIKVRVPRTQRWSVLYYFGNHGEGGLTYTRPNGSAFSVAAGVRAKELVEIGDNALTAELVPSYAFFYDRNGSLLFSVMKANTSRYRFRVNVYPGLLRVRGVTAGLFALWNKDDEVVVGVHLPWLPLGAATRP